MARTAQQPAERVVEDLEAKAIDDIADGDSFAAEDVDDDDLDDEDEDQSDA